VARADPSLCLKESGVIKVSVRARAFIAVVLALGMGAAWLAIADWTSSGLPTFAIFFVACIATSLLRLTLPGIQGSLSVAYVFLLWGITRWAWARPCSWEPSPP
jgi:hypothetical protein